MQLTKNTSEKRLISYNWNSIQQVFHQPIHQSIIPTGSSSGRNPTHNFQSRKSLCELSYTTGRNLCQRVINPVPLSTINHPHLPSIISLMNTVVSRDHWDGFELILSTVKPSELKKVSIEQKIVSCG